MYDHVIDGDVEVMLNVSYSVQVGGVVLRSLHLSSLCVIVEDVPDDAYCKATGDPHFNTFDGQRFDLYLEGEFVMYKHTTLNYEVYKYLKISQNPIIKISVF